jgi:hypothetical protein
MRTPVRRVGVVRVLVAVALLLATASLAAAQAPIYHGRLRTVPAGAGRIDLNSGDATFTVRGWEFLISADSDGVDPAAERVLIAVAEEQLLLPAGSLRASKNGKKYVYRGKTGVRLLKIVRNGPSSLKFTAKLSDVNLARLVISDQELCLPFAIIIGDDDGFQGVRFDRPKPFPSPRITLPGFCEANIEDWPWR